MNLKRKAIVTSVIVAFAVVCVAVVLMLSAIAKPLYGNFDIGVKCMGGHENFLLLEESAAYQNCPGHRSKQLIGPVVRKENQITIIRATDSKPCAQVDFDGDTYKVVWLSDGSSQDVFKVISPLRTQLPRLLPE